MVYKFLSARNRFKGGAPSLYSTNLEWFQEEGCCSSLVKTKESRLKYKPGVQNAAAAVTFIVATV